MFEFVVIVYFNTVILTIGMICTGLVVPAIAMSSTINRIDIFSQIFQAMLLCLAAASLYFINKSTKKMAIARDLYRQVEILEKTSFDTESLISFAAKHARSSESDVRLVLDADSSLSLSGCVKAG